MSALLGKRSEKPGACGVCGRRSGPFGLAVKTSRGSVKGFRALWVCNDPECLQLAKKVMSMSFKDLDSFEAGIMVGAISKSASEIITAVLTEIFEMNISDITQIDGDTIDKIAKRMEQSEITKDALSTFLIKWGDEARRELELGAPF